jgi:hypothetical protein
MKKTDASIEMALTLPIVAASADSSTARNFGSRKYVEKDRPKIAVVASRSASTEDIEAPS